MAGEDAFEIAAAVAAVSGLAALLILSLVAIFGAWRLFRQASDNAVATARAVVAVEDLARRLTVPAGPAAAGAGDGQLADVRQQLAALADQQRQLQEAARQLFEGGGLPATAALPEIDDLEAMVGRLDTTVGQMAASLANLIQLLEHERR